MRRAKSLTDILRTTACLPLLFLLSTANASIPLEVSQQAQREAKIPTGQLKFSHLKAADGLSSSNVFAITQDQQGYLWIATEDGLNRFDGSKFKTYRHNINNQHSIADNVIRKVFVDNNNTLWIGTQNGLSRYNRELDNFDNFVHQPDNNQSLHDNIIWDIYQDKNNTLWVSTETGLQSLALTSNKLYFNRLSITGENNKLKEIKSIYHDKANKKYWLGTYDNGIHIVNNDINEAAEIKDNATYSGVLHGDNPLGFAISAKALFDIKEIDEKLWLATENGVYVISKDNNNNYALFKHYTVENGLLSQHIRAIEKYDNNNVWIATDQGLNLVNRINHKITSQQNNTDSASLSENWLMDIFKDKNNTMWLASYGGGLNKYSPLTAKFHHELAFDNTSYRVESFTELSNGDIYFSTEQQGVFSFIDNEINKIDIDVNENIRRVYGSNEPILWFYTDNGKLYQYSTDSNFLLEHPEWQGNSEYSIDQLIIFLNDSLWYINTSGHLTQYILATREFLLHKTEYATQLINFHKSYDNQLILISSDNQVIKFDIELKKFTQLDLSISDSFNVENATTIADSKNYLFLGSNSQGVLVLDKLDQENYLFDENSGLNNNFIGSIIVDKNGFAWFSTNKGISVLNPKSKDVIHFDKDFSLNNPEFLKFSSLKSKSNRLYFGSPKGFYHFLPESLLSIKQIISTPLFTDLFIANKKINIAPRNSTATFVSTGKNNNAKTTKQKSSYLLPKQINDLDKITLNHDHSPVGFEFVSPNAKLPNQLRYKYRLDGLEENWISASLGFNRATYTNLSPGLYTFHIQAYDIQTPSNQQNASIKLEVLPPWWLTNTAILLYILVAILFVSFIFQHINNRRLYHEQVKQNEERLKLSLWGSGDEMWDWNITTGKIFRSNIWGMLDFPQDGKRNEFEQIESIESNSATTTNEENDETVSNIHQQDLARVNASLDAHFAGETEHFESAYRVRDKAGKWIWILDRGKVVERDHENAPKRMTGTLKDITQIKETEERLKLFGKCIENISDAMVIYNHEFILVDANKAYTRITGNSKESMLGQPLIFAQYSTQFTQSIKDQLIDKGSWHGEIESKRDDGSTYFTDLNLDIIFDESGNISHYVGIFSDITKRKETELELRRLANSDTLTGLPNRSLFQANQTQMVNNKLRHALLVFDLDNFKKINDSLGHQIGDAILCKIAKRLLNIGRKQDSVYRLGGDEFSVLVKNTNDIHTITSIAKEILTTIARPFKVRNQEIVLYSSIGIVLYPDDGLGPHELLKNADTAMYHAKHSGGNKYQFFSDSMNKEAVQRLDTENLIRLALKQDAFTVFYQPKIAIATGQVAGMEALVRCETRTHGFLSPAKFIPVSEETGQIIDIGEVVLRKACQATKKWVDAGLFTGRVAVNLSAVQFTQVNLVSMIASILKETQLSANYLELEITEGTVMDAPQKAIETMKQLRAMGIHLSLDDFGTGYSSLAYLKKFPLNTLKIDKAFVDDIEQSEQGRNMVATIVTIAHNLDMEVVAEGVENNKQLTFLSSLGCEQLQGYLYSKPLATDKFQQYLLSHQITKNSTSFSFN
ncbi:EAL domain-containing protein [Litorilituus sediminis]|uniref:EAL domain-containing protein n=1 Tax=Litorilituus sediminis TaxID=718192 RepID=UPI001476DD3A|nr:EAL domain-containing protein [Litorilituus sediminis]